MYTVSSPVGFLELRATDRGLSHARFIDAPAPDAPEPDPDTPAGRHLRQAAAELEAYFLRGERSFTVPLDPAGTEFQRAVWRGLLAIPCGQTTTYGQLAKALGNSKGSQAVGAANGQNPIAVIIPCHRVVGTAGKLTGYAGGIARKKWLLRHEAATLF